MKRTFIQTSILSKRLADISSGEDFEGDLNMAKREPKMMGEGLIQGLKEAVAHSQGELKLRSRSRELPRPAPKWTASQIRKLRKEVYQMSQPAFAILLNITAATVRSWEQGQKSPSGAAARLLQILANDHRTMERLIAA